MKKKTLLTLIAITMLSLAACGKTEETSGSNINEPVQESQITESQPEPTETPTQESQEVTESTEAPVVEDAPVMKAESIKVVEEDIPTSTVKEEPKADAILNSVGEPAPISEPVSAPVLEAIPSAEASAEQTAEGTVSYTDKDEYWTDRAITMPAEGVLDGFPQEELAVHTYREVGRMDFSRTASSSITTVWLRPITVEASRTVVVSLTSCRLSRSPVARKQSSLRAAQAAARVPMISSASQPSAVTMW